MASVLRQFLFLLVFLLIPLARAEASYTLGAGDEIRLSVYGQPDLTTEAQIGAEGFVEIPLVGRVLLGGRTATQAAQTIAQEFEQGNYLKHPQVNILVTEYRSQTVSILGKVNHPGRLVLQGPTSLTEALAWAGGIASDGSERLILIRTDSKGHQVRSEFDLQKLLNSEAERSQVVWLAGGDTLYVPVSGRFYLSGEVRNPGIYPLDRPLNVMQALGVGGGLTPRASERSVKLFRKQADGTVRESRAKPEDVIADGDILVVQESLF